MWRYIKSGLETASTLLVCVAAIAIVWRMMNPTPTRPGGSARPNVEKVKGLTIASAGVSNVRGNGKVALVEFADYECPFCARHTQETGPTIDKELIDSGQVRHVFFNFPLPIHPRAPKASEAAECASKQGKVWEMHEKLFGNPRKLEVADLLVHAETVGIDPSSFVGADFVDQGHFSARGARRFADDLAPLVRQLCR